MTTPSQVPAGWYPDPAGLHEKRYWDGSNWTAMVSDGAATAVDPSWGMTTPGAAAAGVPAAGVPAVGQPAAGVPAVGVPAVGQPAAQIWPPSAPPGPVGGRGRRKWAIGAAAFVVVLVAVAGLVVWAPWTPPPVLRPVGLHVGQPTTSSAAFGWSRPATGPLPDRYLILRDGKLVASVRGTATSYQDSGLAPATAYQYRVAAVRGGKRSPVSATLDVTTATPPLSAARVQGPWAVVIKIVRGGTTLTGKGPKTWSEAWQVSPSCAAGACTVRLSGQWNTHAFKATLARAGAVYVGKTIANVFPCGTGPNAFPIHSTLKIRLKITAAATENQAWTATSLVGTINVASPYTASGSFYCAADTLTATVSGT